MLEQFKELIEVLKDIRFYLQKIEYNTRGDKGVLSRKERN